MENLSGMSIFVLLMEANRNKLCPAEQKALQTTTFRPCSHPFHKFFGLESHKASRSISTALNSDYYFGLFSSWYTWKIV